MIVIFLDLKSYIQDTNLPLDYLKIFLGGPYADVKTATGRWSDSAGATFDCLSVAPEHHSKPRCGARCHFEW